MLPLLFEVAKARPFRLLCLGAHCDDIGIGCGGTILRLLEAIPGTEVRWVTMTGSLGRREEEGLAAEAFLEKADADYRVEMHDFRESFLPQEWAAVKETFERLKQDFEPSVILTHARHDGHQDHRVVAELTWNTFRDHLVLEYEIPKYDGDLRQPGFYVPLTAAQADAKVATLLRCFPSQHRRPWFEERTFRALMRLRGMECNAESGYAEAFHVRKVVV